MYIWVNPIQNILHTGQMEFCRESVIPHVGYLSVTRNKRNNRPASWALPMEPYK